jgi:hypothetical protein
VSLFLLCCSYFQLSLSWFVVRSQQYVEYCWREVSLFLFCFYYFRLSLFRFVVKSQHYCTILLVRGVSVIFLLSLVLVVPVSVYCQVPTVLYSTVGERCLCFRFIVTTFGCTSSGLLSGRCIYLFFSLLSVAMPRSIISDVLVVCYFFIPFWFIVRFQQYVPYCWRYAHNMQ